MADPNSTTIDPIHQFELVQIIPALGLTQSSLYMLAATGIITLGVWAAARQAALVPGRLQSLVEMSYEFVAGTVRQSAGEEGMKFFPLVFSLFTFVLVLNLLGMLPYGFTVTSHIIITFALAMVVMGTVVVYGFMRHGTHFFQLFVPSGIPGYILPLVAAIEVISFLSRPVSLSVRLFANMLAGHIALKIFAAFVASLLSYSVWTVLLAPLPLALAIAFTALEFLVAFLQAYVFSLLACMYLNDALHPGH
jgi:F-type H+-transporting ATPase subunit a